VVGPTLRDLVPELANWRRGTRRPSGVSVDVHAIRVVRCAVGSLSLAGIAHVLIECPLAVGNAIRLGCGLLGRHLCLDLLVGLCLGDDVGQKLEVLYASNCVCCGYVSGMIQGQGVGRGMYSPTSRYWMFLLGLRSDLTTLCDCSTRCWRNISVATVITKAALLLQLLISSS
jgi:hypothetical protein